MKEKDIFQIFLLGISNIAVSFALFIYMYSFQPLLFALSHPVRELLFYKYAIVISSNNHVLHLFDLNEYITIIDITEALINKQKNICFTKQINDLESVDPSVVKFYIPFPKAMETKSQEIIRELKEQYFG